MVLGLEESYNEALMDGVILLGAPVEMHMRQDFRFFWSTEARREMRSQFQKYLGGLSLVRMMLIPLLVRSRSSTPTKWTEYLARVDLCGPVEIAAKMEVIGQGSPTKTGKPSLAYDSRRSTSG